MVGVYGGRDERVELAPRGVDVDGGRGANLDGAGVSRLNLEGRRARERMHALNDDGLAALPPAVELLGATNELAEVTVLVDDLGGCAIERPRERGELAQPDACGLARDREAEEFDVLPATMADLGGVEPGGLRRERSRRFRLPRKALTPSFVRGTRLVRSGGCD
jgi:hypothetical protein